MLLLALAVLVFVQSLRWSGPDVTSRLAAMDERMARAQLTYRLSPWFQWSSAGMLVLAVPGLFWNVVSPEPRPLRIAIATITVGLFAIALALQRRAQARMVQAAVDLELSPTKDVLQGPTRSRRIRRWGSVALVAGLAVGLGVHQPDRLEGTAYFVPLVAVTSVGMLVLAVAAVVLGFTATGRFDDDREVLA